MENRIIKFRVWDKSAKLNKADCGTMIPHEYAIESAYFLDALDSKYPIMQFTGLLDKNGKEIYEDDVINVPYNRIGYVHVKYIANEVRYNISGYKLSVIEVVGNIHEHKNLLRK